MHIIPASSSDDTPSSVSTSLSYEPSSQRPLRTFQTNKVSANAWEGLRPNLYRTTPHRIKGDGSNVHQRHRLCAAAAAFTGRRDRRRDAGRNQPRRARRRYVALRADRGEQIVHRVARGRGLGRGAGAGAGDGRPGLRGKPRAQKTIASGCSVPKSPVPLVHSARSPPPRRVLRVPSSSAVTTGSAAGARLRLTGILASRALLCSLHLCCRRAVCARRSVR